MHQNFNLNTGFVLAGHHRTATISIDMAGMIVSMEQEAARILTEWPGILDIDDEDCVVLVSSKTPLCANYCNERSDGRGV